MKRLNAVMNNPRSVLLMLAVFLVAGLVVVFSFDGTGDTGDSIMHYLFARYAFDHPALFLDSWAKPMFVIFAAPFAQMGFVGIKFFNLLIAVGTAYLLYRILLRSGNPYAWLALPFLLASPLFFVLIFSGLTEYFFAFLWIAGAWLFAKNKYIAGALLISFLPFARSEGLLLLPCALIFLAFRRQWAAIPLLLAGHVVFGLAGWMAGRDFLWMFTENAYTSFSNEYGTGPWTHFLSQLPYVIGIPLYFLLGVGLILLLFRIFAKNRKQQADEQLSFKIMMIVLPAVGFILFHTTCYALGLFHSMGLKRVLICVVPLLIYIVIDGLGYLRALTSKWPYALSASMIVLFISMVLIFPLTSGPAAVKRSELMPSGLHQQMLVFSGELQHRFDLGDYKKIYCTQPSLLMQLDLDPFNPATTGKVVDYVKASGAGSFILIWDCEFSEHEDGVSADRLLNDQKLKLVWQYPEGDSPCYLVFLPRPSDAH